MKTTISLLCTLGYINAQAFDYSTQGADWSMGSCNSSKTMSPIEIPAFTEVVDETAEEGAEKEYKSTSKNQKYVEKREDYSLSAKWDTSGKVAVFTGDDAGEGILGYRFTSSKDSAATYITLTDVVTSVDEEGVETSNNVDVIDKSDLISLVVRSPSEHTLNGEYQDVEVQYFYESTTTDGKFSAMSVFYSATEEAGDSALLKLIAAAKSTTFKLATYNNSIINEESSFIKYDGQYTNPRNAG